MSIEIKCTPENPMPPELANAEERGIWVIHVDVTEDFETETRVGYTCNSCGHQFTIFLGD